VLRGIAMSIEELKMLLEGIDLGTLSRDELEHAVSLLGYKAERDDTDRDLTCILVGSLRG
jgi:hypothetical protein